MRPHFTFIISEEPISKYSHIPMDWGLGLQLMNFGEKQYNQYQQFCEPESFKIVKSDHVNPIPLPRLRPL